MSSLFLINPGSGKRKNISYIQSLIRKEYAQAGEEARIEEINFENLSLQLAQAEKVGVRRVFAVGGDGTVNAIGSRLIGTSMHFGVIPLGSGNGYARNLGISIKIPLAIRQSLDAHTILADTGEFAGHTFLNVAGIGLDAEVARIFAENDRRGFRPYVKSTVHAIMNLKPDNISLTIDGEVREFQNVFGVVIANGGQWGYDAKVARNVSLTDGIFDILVVKKFSVLEAGFLVSRMFNGTLANSKNIIPLQGQSVTIRRQEAGYIQIDGEPLQAKAEIEAKINPQSLHLLLPNTLTIDRINQI